MRGLAFLVSAQLAACPVCNSGTGQQVRQSIFGDGFEVNLAVAILPFLICAGIVCLIAEGRLL
jgi:hypothetical protein